MNVNNLFALPHFHLFPIYSTYVANTEPKIGNNVSEFMHSDWITQSYYSIPKHKSPLHRYLINFSDFCTL